MGCAPEDLLFVRAEVPAEVDFVAILFQGPSGEVLGGTGLIERPAGEPLRAAISPPEPTVALLVTGFGAEDVSRLGVALAALSRAPVRFAVPGERLLPNPKWAVLAPREGGDATSAAAADPLELTSDGLGACPDPCSFLPVDVRSGREVITPSDKVVVAVPWDQERRAALLITALNRALRWTATSAVSLDALVLPETIEDALLAVDGSIWLLGVSGTLYRGRPEIGFAPRATLRGAPSSGGRIAEGADGTLYAVTPTTFEHVVDPASPVVLHTSEPQRSAVAALPDGALAVFHAASEIVRVREGAEPSISREITAPLAVEQVAGLGTILGTDSEPDSGLFAGLYLLEQDGSWSKLGSVTNLFSAAIEGVFPLGGGFLFGGVTGVLGYYHAGVGACAPKVLFAHGVRDIVELGDHRAVAVGQPRDRSPDHTGTEFFVPDPPDLDLRCAGVR
ncbi:MAG: hypothetical protein IT384_25315 [Deltaproteobacteria bacterium]|nr:hypothetical protein [Deltaproteobacteria bacterium]